MGKARRRGCSAYFPDIGKDPTPQPRGDDGDNFAVGACDIA